MPCTFSGHIKGERTIAMTDDIFVAIDSTNHLIIPRVRFLTVKVLIFSIS